MGVVKHTRNIRSIYQRTVKHPEIPAHSYIMAYGIGFETIVEWYA